MIPQPTGLTLRQYYAAMAMQGDWAAQSRETGEYLNDAYDADLVSRARIFFRMADAMIRAEQEESK